MEFVSPIITSIVESLMVPVKKHLGYFFSSSNHVGKMRAQLLELNHAAHDMENKRETNEASNLVIPDHVPGWLAEVKTVNEEAGCIPPNSIGCFNVKLRYKAGKGSFDILKKIDDLQNQESRIKWTNEQIPLGMVISNTRSSTSKHVHDFDGTQNILRSRQLIFKDVLKSLEPDSKTQKMALCGMGGIGKTTMMEELKKTVEKRGMFKWVLRVVIGEKPGPFAIQQAIAECMSGALTETTRVARADRLAKRFEGMSENGTKKILIILDDVWEEVNLKDIGLTSPLPNGFKLLVTSRDEKVCLKMDIEICSIFRVVGLDQAEANSLFWETVRVSDEDGELGKIGEDILKKCGGLPMAIKTIALTLRGEKKDAWTSALVRLQRHDLEDLYAVVDGIFEISYTNLRKDDDKAIFILCGLFPDDFDIVVEDLLRYGWGLKFYNNVCSLVEARQRTNTSVSNLIRANLLIESHRIGRVKMHDLARSFVLSNISKFKQASIVNQCDKSEWPTQDIVESCERILLNCIDITEFPQDFSFPNLGLLKLMNGDKLLKFPEDFHKRTKKLEVIAYDKMNYPLLPVSLRCSTSLRTLCLRLCLLVDIDISFIGDLINLEVLCLAHCGIRKLPSAIGKLKKLKLLDLTGDVELCIENNVFQNLVKLEELYLRVSKIRFIDARYDELKILSRKLYALEVEFFKNILDPKNLSFNKLQRFRISMGCQLEKKTVHSNDEYLFKNTLKLVTNCNELLESKVNELFCQTEELHLCVKDMSCAEDISMHLYQHPTFSNLKDLNVFNCADLTHLFPTPIANGLKKLEFLRVSSCPNLKSLVSACDGVNVIEFRQLVELHLNELPKFTSIFPENNTHPFFNKEVMIPKLAVMKVINMENLKYIWPCHVASDEEDNVSMLRRIEVQMCNNLVNLFPCNPMRLLSHLELLIINNCCSIEVLFNIDLGKIGKLSTCTSNLRKIEAYNLLELREVWRINGENNSAHLICGFQAIETIDIGRCMKFRNVFTPATVNFDLGALMDIRMYSCGENSGRHNIELANNGQKKEISGISKRETSKYDEKISTTAFSSPQFTHTFNHLHKITLNDFKEVEVLFDLERPSINRELITTQQPLHLFPCLEDLVLWHMDTLSHVWKCSNWNEFFIIHKHQPQSSFQNLTTITVRDCKSLKYLFSPRMCKLLSNLKTISIVNSKVMEEVISNIDDEDEVLTMSATTLFPHLHNLDLDDLYNLKRIGGCVAKGTNDVIHDQFKFCEAGVVSWSLCQYAIEMNIGRCVALSSVVPSCAAGQMQKLQVLNIRYCRSLVEVFATKEHNNNNTSGCSSNSSNVDQGIHTTLPFLRPKNITMHELSNLKMLKICYCDLLEYIFTFSTLESLKKLEKLSIKGCKGMKVIVREENGEASSTKAVVVFPRLKSIELKYLPNLAGFFLGMNNNFHWPSLDYVMITDCPQMTVFTYGDSETPKLTYVHTWLGKHNLECGLNFHQIPSPSSDSPSLCHAITKGSSWSLHNLIEMDVHDNANLKKIIPSNELQNLETIYIYRCDSVEEVFEVTSGVTNNESQTVVKFPKLREVKLDYLKRLKYIWGSNHRSILEFPKLTKLSINGCGHLEHVFMNNYQP